MENRETENYEATLRARALVYELGHVVFGGAPDTSLFDVLRSDSVWLSINDLSTEYPTFTAFEKVIDDFVVHSEAVLAQAKSEYSRCILGLGGKTNVQPWETYYTRSDKLLFQRETLAIRNTYKTFGFKPNRQGSVPDDHVALECAFMAALSQKSVESFLNEDEEDLQKLIAGQLAFLRNHLSCWIGSFAHDLSLEAPHGLYASLASALDEFIKGDIAFLQAAKADQKN